MKPFEYAISQMDGEKSVRGIPDGEWFHFLIYKDVQLFVREYSAMVHGRDQNVFRNLTYITGTNRYITGWSVSMLLVGMTGQKSLFSAQIQVHANEKLDLALARPRSFHILARAAKKEWVRIKSMTVSNYYIKRHPSPLTWYLNTSKLHPLDIWPPWNCILLVFGHFSEE